MITFDQACTGCSICALSCPVHAINIQLNEDGFFEPKVNDACINCGYCQKVCPKEHVETFENIHQDSEMYAAKSKEELENSSSGGIAYLLSQYALEHGTKVCGVYYDGIDDLAKHIVIEQKEDLHLLQGSKYLASDAYQGFKAILDEKNGMIFGTPCQIAGIHFLLSEQNRREQFILVDIFCHGVPSYLIWKQHQAIINKQNETVQFRNKDEYFVKTNTYKQTSQTDPFYYYYLRNLVNRESCYQCKYRRNSYADIRLGDYTTKDSKGLSIVILNTLQGRIVFEQLKNKLEFKKANFKVVDQNQQKGNMKVPVEKSNILNELKSGKSVQKVLGKKKIFLQYIKGYMKKIIRR